MLKPQVGIAATATTHPSFNYANFQIYCPGMDLAVS